MQQEKVPAPLLGYSKPATSATPRGQADGTCAWAHCLGSPTHHSRLNNRGLENIEDHWKEKPTERERL